MSYKVIFVFTLKEGTADEELRRSEAENSFSRLLMKQPGCIDIELVKIDDSKTMSIQTWQSEENWRTALNAVKAVRQADTSNKNRDEILISRDFLAGKVLKQLSEKESEAPDTNA